MTHRYRVFGGTLESELDFPELPPGAGAPDWVLRIQPGTLPSASERAIGEDAVHANIKVRGYSGPADLSLAFDDTGIFRVTRQSRGREILWNRPDGATPRTDDAARLDVLGRVLALALHVRGVLCLHASAVAFGEQAIALMAPKFHGKSTLAGALVRAGAELLSDDTVPIEPGEPLRLLPGVVQLRLWSDSARAAAPVDGVEVRETSKTVIDPTKGLRAADRAVPFAAAYVLNPVPPGSQSAPVERTRLGGMQAAMSLVEHSKLGPLLGGIEAPVLLGQATVVASAVPVYVLSVVRDLDLLSAAAAGVAGWHAPASSSM